MTHNQVVDPLFPQCPVRNVMARIGNRWSLLVLLTLQGAEKPMRFGNIGKAIPDVSQKMLTATLRDLEADGLVNRTVYAEIPPHVEYELTERARTLMPLLNQLVEWSLANLSGIIKSRESFLNKNNK